MFRIILILIIISSPAFSFAKNLHVGNNQKYSNLEESINDVIAGDTIFFHNGTFNGGQFAESLKGSPDNRITLLAETDGSVIISGGNNSWRLSNAENLIIQGFVFENQTSNGFNLDDGGDYSSPAKNIIFQNCTFQNITATGNNDLLKLSGLDNFEINNCTFKNGSAGGSGIDMVGCHNGTISSCSFENMGSNAIQAKGGTANITIARNYFKNCGYRTLNLGGSTGLKYFRPLDAKYEVSDLNVYANVIIGSDAAIAYVGAVNVKVVNNTIVNPSMWVIRVLQETVDPSRFLPCGNNFFQNNIIYYGEIKTETNIGGNTNPDSFTFSNNLWFKSTNPETFPSIPVSDSNIITGKKPEFSDILNENFYLKENSPAKEKVIGPVEPKIDYLDHPFLEPRSIGAIEDTVKLSSSLNMKELKGICNVYPNPCDDQINIKSNEIPLKISLYNENGLLLNNYFKKSVISVRTLPDGVYFIEVHLSNITLKEKILIAR